MTILLEASATYFIVPGFAELFRILDILGIVSFFNDARYLSPYLSVACKG